MKKLQQFMAVIQREGNGFVALCPELDIASQGNTVEEARRNLTEALELFFETADVSEVRRRLQSEVFDTHLEVAVGQAASAVWPGNVQQPRKAPPRWWRLAP